MSLDLLAEVVAILATGLAAAAFGPDGVSVLGRHWCTTHPCPHPGGSR